MQQPSLRLFQFYLRQRHGGIFSVGKHNGEWFDYVFSSDPGYTAWVCSLPDASGDLLAYQAFAHAAAQSASRTRSRSRRARRTTRSEVQSFEPADTDQITWPSACQVCYDLPVRTIFRCGHAVACTRCALEIQRLDKPECPICRRPVLIGDVIRVFPA